MIEFIPAHEMKIWRTLVNAGFDCFLVGGSVRDFLMNKIPNDFDFATNARPEEISSLFPESITHFEGATFGTMFVDGVEIATFRKENYRGNGDKDVETEFSDSLLEDLGRRDFTMNAIAMDINGSFFDLFGGIEDIKNKIIRFVGDPKMRIFEDPNRVVRLARFAARFEDFTIHLETLECVIEMAPEKVHLIAPERVRKEGLKTMESSKFASIFSPL